MQKHFDIIIIGAGIVGLTFANLIADYDLKVAILDNNAKPELKIDPKHDLRVSAITVGSENILAKIHCWTKLKNIRVSPFRYMQVWDENGKGKINFSAFEIGQTHLGHIIENNVLTYVLTEQCHTHPNIAFFYSVSPCKLISEKNDVSVLLNNNKKISAKLLVGADGSKSWLRQQANIPCEFKSYDHTGLVTTVKTQLPHNETAYQRFLGDGILAFLPLVEKNLCSIVWSTKPNIAENLATISEDSFKKKLSLALDYKLGDIVSLEQRLTFPLFKQHAKTYITHHIALIGDAAHSIHPLAGQGLNLGIMDANALAEIIGSACQQNRNFADIAMLNKYQQQRKTTNSLMIGAMSAFKTVFGIQIKPIILARNFGLNLVDKVSPLKHFFMEIANSND